MAKKGAVPKEGAKIISTNKKARFRYQLIESFEAGIVLTGAEIKAIRQSGISITESYVQAKGGELFLIGAHVKPYTHSDDSKYDPIRPRKLLMHKREIDKLLGRSAQKGLTIVPLKVYLKRGRAKVEVALAKGKDMGDKRETVKEREAKREMSRAVKQSS